MSFQVMAGYARVLWFLLYIFLFLNFLRHQTMDKVQKYNSLNKKTSKQ
jgi:hypothetical protein